jgi:transcriptional regulator with XRE-family HTH domain
MNTARVLRQARTRAGLTQRALARRVGVPQSAIARIERGGVIPRVDSLDRLLAGCGEGLESRPRLGQGLDPTVIRELLALTPGQRARLAAQEASNMAAALGRIRS